MVWSTCTDGVDGVDSTARTAPRTGLRGRRLGRRLGRWLFDRTTVNTAYLRTEMTWAAYGIHLALSSVFGALLHLEAVSRFLGVGPALGVKLILGNLIPYSAAFIWARRTGRFQDRGVWFVLFMAHLNLFLIGALIVAAGARPLSAFWAFYFLYVGAMANAFGFQPYLLLLVIVAGIAPGWLGREGSSSRWVAAGLFAFLGAWQYCFLGLMARRTLALERRTGALERGRRIAEERARIAEETSTGLGQALAEARSSSEALAAVVDEGDAATLSAKLLDTQDRLRRAMSQVRQALWSLESTPCTVADLLSHMKRCFGDLCQAAGTDLVTSLPVPATDLPATDLPATDLPATDLPAFVLSPLLKHQIYCIALEAVVAALRRPGLSRITASARHDEHQLELSIEDDAEAVTEETALTSLISSRAVQVGGTVGLRHPPRGGTAVSLRVPLAGNQPPPEQVSHPGGDRPW